MHCATLELCTLGSCHTWIGAHLDWVTLGLGQVDLMPLEKCLYSQDEG